MKNINNRKKLIRIYQSDWFAEIVEVMLTYLGNPWLGGWNAMNTGSLCHVLNERGYHGFEN